MEPARPVDGFFTRGQPVAVAAVRAMLGPHPPHAVLLVGPPSVGKTTLALDLAAGRLCTHPEAARRPCRTCRGCRLVAAGNHPDLHRLAPGGAGRQILIGEPADAAPGTIRHLVGELALLPVEGGPRVAVIEQAQRMNEDAQNALLKTLEEPPAGVTIVLCADDEDRLLPTVRSRCARVRLGPVAGREIEVLLGERGVADPPTAARLARLAAGRSGLAFAYALAPEAVLAREELARSLLDLLGTRPAGRLAVIRHLLARASELAAALDRALDVQPVPAPGAGPRTGRGAARPTRGRAPGAGGRAGGPGVGLLPGEPEGSNAGDAEDAPGATVESDAPDAADGSGAPGRRITAAERRRSALALLDVWRDLARDLAVVARGARSGLRDPGLLDDLETAARAVDPVATATFLARLERTAGLVEANANPELALDVLVLAWPDAAAA